mmetsp:Transcript_21725/g.16034  ORF Transcript_21725/g.16034 Transcript_21725/m.16034 type:complete len:334 (-) Transcript_21725:432-1433(-)
MSTLTSAPFSLPVNTLVEVRIYAHNSYGDGETSDVNSAGAKTKTTPATMAAPVEGSDTSETQVQIQFTHLTSASDQGYSTILGYRVYYGVGAGSSANTFVGQTTDSEYTITGLTQGTTYSFAVAAKNIYGEGTKSTTVDIMARDVPETPNTVVVTLQTTTTLRVDFTPPDNNGLAITKYQILIYDPSSGNYVEDTTYCDGNGAAFTATYCDFGISYLIATYSYSIGDLLQAKVRAYNSEGWSLYSSVNTAGQELVSVPAQMNDPFSGIGSLGSTLVVEYEGLTTVEDTGNSAILSYELYWDQGTTSWTSLQGVSTDSTLTSYTLNSLTVGNAY